MQRQALDKEIGEELIRQESQKLVIEGIDEIVQRKLADLEKKHGSGERFEMFLKQRHLTMEELKESLRKRAFVDEYLKTHGISEPQIPEARIKAAYDANPGNYSRKESAKVSHILVGVDANASAEEKQEAREKAEMIRRLLLENIDFAEMAQKYSDCNSKSSGGSLSYIKRGFMPAEFDKVAFALDEETLSDVVETKFGYHIIKVFDKKLGKVIPYEEVKEFIEKFLQEKESNERLAAHIAELKKDAKTEILLTD